jgi:hypothetical protein
MNFYFGQMSASGANLKFHKALVHAVDEWMEKTYPEHRGSCEWNFWTEYLLQLMWKQVDEVKMLRSHLKGWWHVHDFCQLHHQVMQSGRNPIYDSSSGDDEPEVGFND